MIKINRPRVDNTGYKRIMKTQANLQSFSKFGKVCHKYQYEGLSKIN